MIAMTESFIVPTRGKGTYEITSDVEEILVRSGIRTGIVTIFIQHTSASLVIYENADPRHGRTCIAFLRNWSPKIIRV